MVENVTIHGTFYGVVERITLNGVTKILARNSKWNADKWFKHTDTGIAKAKAWIAS